MMVSLGATLRVTIVVGLICLTQISAMPHLTIAGFVIDLFLILTVISGILAGIDRAVGIGFSCGLLADLVVNSPFGMNTLVLVLVGWGAGALAPQLVETNRVLRSLAVGLTAASGVALYALMAWLIGYSYDAENRVELIVLITGMAAFFVNLFLERIVKWTLFIEPVGYPSKV
ncbi:MAG TPA: rod shape-determining protein MreD [Acidimicrobiaceae bacterium]|nr:rod shape-determining protein MreD [Acidimicrobiaceae bacterium]